MPKMAALSAEPHLAAVLLHDGRLREKPMSVTIAPTAVQAEAVAGTPEKKTPEHSGLGFGDLLDVINPLQHIPLIGTIYRRITGDKMSAAAEIAGGALYGGVIGTVASIADVLFTQETGRDFGETVMGWLGFKNENPTQFAAASTKRNSFPVATGAVPASLARPVVVSAVSPRMISPPSRVRPATQAAPLSGAAVPGLPSLMDALQKQGVDPGTAARAAFAYRSAIGWREQNPSPAPAYRAASP
jgi:hypothetical protein